MIKLIILSRRKAGTTHEQYVEHHREQHAPLFTSQTAVKQNVRRYVQNHTTSDHLEGRSMAPYDGVVEMWFDDMDGVRAVFESEEYKQNIVPDEDTFLDRQGRMMLFATENVVLP